MLVRYKNYSNERTAVARNFRSRIFRTVNFGAPVNGGHIHLVFFVHVPDGDSVFSLSQYRSGVETYSDFDGV